MKIAEMQALTLEELARQLEAARKEQLDLRFRLATKQLVNIRETRRVRKEIARLQTIMRQKELGLR
ncbi:MAG: 50S ribosomal protein L29 [Chloroflexi bacterium]|nr:50S ribosomal protein L29 [Chloroflexota bacterium]